MITLNILEKMHIPTTVRREMGTDIQAACGQLRNQYECGIRIIQNTTDYDAVMK